MTADAIPDLEGGCRTWLRTLPSISAIVSNRVFFGIPKAADESKFPLITVARVGGGLGPTSDAPVDAALLQFDVWGSLDASGNGKKAEVTALVNTLRSELAAIRGRTALTATVAAFGFVEQSCIWLPDPDNDRPRYVLTVEACGISS